jgi:hypothetical protein
MTSTASTDLPSSEHLIQTMENLLGNPSSEELESDDDDDAYDDDDDDTSVEESTNCDNSEGMDSSEFMLTAAPSRLVSSKTLPVSLPPVPESPPVPPPSTRASVAAKKPGGGIFLSNAMQRFLTRNHSDGDLMGTHKNDPIFNLIHRSESAEKLTPSDDSRMIFVHQDKPKPAVVDKGPAQQHPKDLLKELLLANNCTHVEPTSSRTLVQQGTYFLRVTPTMIATYDMTLMTAVRSNDLNSIQDFYRAGKNLQCCNRFHESILHTAARRGSTEVMEFLLNTAHLELKVVCDSGRTPLHDACWTGRPNFAIVRMILEVAPDFLLIADHRNYTPLDYVPKESYKEWCQFLTENQTLWLPRELVGAVEA